MSLLEGPSPFARKEPLRSPAHRPLANGHAANEEFLDLVEPHECAGAVSLDDFYAYMPAHNYLYVPTRSAWPAASVNARIPPIELSDKTGALMLDANGKQVTVSAAAWLDRNK